jgi:uncharacterized protein (TIGR02145 family)
MHFRVRYIFGLFSLLSFLILVGCDKDSSTSPSNNPPVITSITASPATVSTGETINLSCVATDEDGDELAYTWSSLDGSFPNEVTGSTVEWQAPESTGSYQINISVDDGEDVAYDSVTVDIEIYGCTDFEALNYNPNVTDDDGSCAYYQDYDGNYYQAILIGEQLWMAEDLKTTHYNNGDPIPTGFTNSEWTNLDDTETGAYAIYNNDPTNAETYGNLYNWYAVSDDRGVCPEGFHMPTDEEWMQLEMYLGMSYEEAHDSGYRGTDQGSQLAGNANLWSSGGLVSNPAFGSSGFLALPGGYRNYGNGSFYTVGNYGFFWSSSEYHNSHAWSRNLYYNNSEVNRANYYKRLGFSVRCLGD